MNFILGNSFTEKTTCLFQIGYNFLDKRDNSDDFIYYISQSFDSECKNQLLGKYNIISEDIIEKIHIKICDSYECIIDFLKHLFLIPQDFCPSIILIDNIDLFYRVQQGKFSEDMFNLKQFEILSSILSLIKKLNKIKKIEFIISVNMDLCINYSKNIEEENNENINILNCLISFANKIFNFIYTKEKEIQCYQLIFNFNPKHMILFIEYKNEVIPIELINDKNHYIESSILEFDELVNNNYNDLKKESI